MNSSRNESTRSHIKVTLVWKILSFYTLLIYLFSTSSTAKLLFSSTKFSIRDHDIDLIIDVLPHSSGRPKIFPGSMNCCSIITISRLWIIFQIFLISFFLNTVLVRIEIWGFLKFLWLDNLDGSGCFKASERLPDRKISGWLRQDVCWTKKCFCITLIIFFIQALETNVLRTISATMGDASKTTKGKFCVFVTKDSRKMQMTFAFVKVRYTLLVVNLEGQKLKKRLPYSL